MYEQHRHYWTRESLLALRRDVGSGLRLIECAKRQGGEVTTADCDLALWALVGTPIEKALYALNLHGTR